MLTASQCETVAVYPKDSGEIICLDCARERFGEIAVSKTTEGLHPGTTGLEPLSRYEIDEHISSLFYDEDTDEYTSDFYPCDSCGKEIS